MTGQDLVGKTGVVSAPVRGGERPGEVRVVVGGIPHYYLAFCPQAVPVGTPILVINNRGHRQIDVEPWALSTTPVAESGVEVQQPAAHDASPKDPQ